MSFEVAGFRVEGLGFTGVRVKFHSLGVHVLGLRPYGFRRNSC